MHNSVLWNKDCLIKQLLEDIKLGKHILIKTELDLRNKVILIEDLENKITWLKQQIISFAAHQINCRTLDPMNWRLKEQPKCSCGLDFIRNHIENM